MAFGLFRKRVPEPAAPAVEPKVPAAVPATEAVASVALVSAERAAQDTKEQARRESDLIVQEAHAESRRVTRESVAEKRRLEEDMVKIRAQLLAAFELLGEWPRSESTKREEAASVTGPAAIGEALDSGIRKVVG
jgi:cell division septum initiation protein DivIVA